MISRSQHIYDAVET